MLWIAFVAYAVSSAPAGAAGGTQALIMDAMLLRTDRVDAGVIAVFNLLGVWPALYAAHLLADGLGRRLPAWPFVLGSCFFGAFALLPYLALREDDGKLRSETSRTVRFFEARAVGVILLLTTLTLVGLGLVVGNLDAYATLFSSEPLVYIMTLDFLVLSSVFPSVLASDMERRGLSNRSLFWLVSCIPLLGPAAYVALRPRLSAPSI